MPPRTGSRRFSGKKKEYQMKFQSIFKSLFLGLALLLATGAFASAANKGSMQLTNPVTVSGKQLPAGSYLVKWDGTGPNVEVSILRGKDVVATTSARLIDLSQKTDNDAAIVKNNADGSKALSEIRFSGKKVALAIGSESASMEGSSSSK
jgi:hypothetical protein